MLVSVKMAKSPEDKQALKEWMNAAFLPVWNGQVDDWSAGLDYIADKTGWTAETIKTDVLPWVLEWNRQKDAADRAGKFMAELPNIGVFFRKQKWKNPLPYSFQELKIREEGNGETELCSCGQPAFNRKLCAKCYTKMANPTLPEHIKHTLRNKGFTKKPGESWRDASMRCLRENGLLSLVPDNLKGE